MACETLVDGKFSDRPKCCIFINSEASSKPASSSKSHMVPRRKLDLVTSFPEKKCVFSRESSTLLRAVCQRLRNVELPVTKHKRPEHFIRKSWYVQKRDIPALSVAWCQGEPHLGKS